VGICQVPTKPLRARQLLQVNIFNLMDHVQRLSNSKIVCHCVCVFCCCLVDRSKRLDLGSSSDLSDVPTLLSPRMAESKFNKPKYDT
jgi:hypothetical protein